MLDRGVGQGGGAMGWRLACVCCTMCNGVTFPSAVWRNDSGGQVGGVV